MPRLRVRSHKGAGITKAPIALRPGVDGRIIPLEERPPPTKTCSECFGPRARYSTYFCQVCLQSLFGPGREMSMDAWLRSEVRKWAIRRRKAAQQ